MKLGGEKKRGKFDAFLSSQIDVPRVGARSKSVVPDFIIHSIGFPALSSRQCEGKRKKKGGGWKKMRLANVEWRKRADDDIHPSVKKKWRRSEVGIYILVLYYTQLHGKLENARVD